MQALTTLLRHPGPKKHGLAGIPLLSRSALKAVGPRIKSGVTSEWVNQLSFSATSAFRSASLRAP